MGLIKQKNNQNFDVKRIGLTYLVRLENESPLNENLVEETGNIHKRITLLNGLEKAKRSGNSVKAHHRHALLDFIGKDEKECDPTVNACGRCLACALHGFAMVMHYPTDLEKNAMHSSLVSFSDLISIEKADDCIYGLRENMLRSPSVSKKGSPQPFSYERIRAGTHFVGTAYLTLTGRKTMYKITFSDEDQIKEAFWYGMRAILTNQTYQQTVMTARHDARFTPLLLIVSEVKNLPADIMVSPDLTLTNLKDTIRDLKEKVQKIKDDANSVVIYEGQDLNEFLSGKGINIPKDIEMECIKAEKEPKETAEEEPEETAEEESED